MYDLGQYRQADKFQQIPSNVVSGALSSVAYPVLLQLNNEKERQRLYFRKLVRINAFLIFPLMFGLVGIAKNFIIVCTNPTWLPSVPLLQILSISAIFMPFQTLCLQLLNAIGLPKWNFRLELTRNMLILFSLLACVFSLKISLRPLNFEFILLSNQTSIFTILISFTVATFFGYAATIFKTGKFINYKMLEHIKDVLPYAVTAFVMLLIIYLITFLKLSIYVELILQIILGGTFYLLTIWLMGSQVIRDVLVMVRGKSI
jgi:O-antigen/teichoic acid export membrane protein